SVKENIIQEQITSTKPHIVMSEIPLENIFNDEDSVFIEKGLKDAEVKEVKPTVVTTTEVTTIEVMPNEDDGMISKQVVTTSRTVVKGDGSVEEKVIVNGEEQPLDMNLLSPPVEVEVEEK
ncbi:hypothetical protein, partial [Salmonella sp. s51933]|uniref:hypothetical protein n=1 Tax=Salmonella sp. s51933 TaxID=3160127 RepID=UPI0037547AA2